MENSAFKKFLEEEYLKRQEKNPSYSLRAFAKLLNIDAGSLSRMLNGQRAFRLKKMKEISLRLGYEFDNLEKVTTQTDLVTLPKETFEFLSNWHYFAILESYELSDFIPTESSLSKKLNISPTKIKIAMNNLFSLKLLRKKTCGSFTPTHRSVSTCRDEDMDELALRKQQVQRLEMAKASIFQNSGERKSHSSMTMAIDPELIPEIKEEIKKFRRKIAKLAETKSKNKTDIYCLQLNFFEEKEYLD